jgi:hypothetical protein
VTCSLAFEELRARGDDLGHFVCIAKFDQGGYRGLLFQDEYGDDQFYISVAIIAFPKTESVMHLTKRIMVWILLPNGTVAHLREVSPKNGGLAEANGTPSLTYMFDRFQEKDSVLLVLKTGQESRIFPFVPAYTEKKP